MAKGNVVIRVGIVIAVGLMLLALVIFSIGTTTHLLTGSRTLQTRFTRVNQLQKGAPVTLSGVTIGAVESLAFPTDPLASYVIVQMRVESSAIDRIHVDSEVHIRTMGLLGDKFIDISPGNRNSPIAPADYLLKSQDPIDYEAILGRKDAGDFFVNIVESSASLRHVLRDIDQGNGVLAQLIHDKRQGQEANHLQQSIVHLDVATGELEQIIHRVNAGQGIAGAFTSNTPQSRQMSADLAASASKLRNATERLDRITQRFESGQGLLPRLIEDRQIADTVIADLQQSTHEAHSILYKIDSGRGTLGKLVNDPELYNQSRSLVGGGGMGLSLLRGLYNVTHPFNRASAASAADSDGSRDSSANSQAVNAQPGSGSGYYSPMPNQQTTYGPPASQGYNNNSQQGYSARQTQQGTNDGSRPR